MESMAWILPKRLPPVAVEYDTKHGRQTKQFSDGYVARRFYVACTKQGLNPVVRKAVEEVPMSEATTVAAVETNGTHVETPAPKATKKKTAVKATPKKPTKKEVKVTKTSAKATKTAPKKPRTTSVELQESVLKFMRKGLDYTTRQVVEGLGREPGSAQGGPVIRALKLLMEEKKVTGREKNEEYTGFVWSKK